MTHDEMIAIIQAHKEGKEIQYFNRITERWEDCLNNMPWLLWNFGCDIYRIKPESHYRPFRSAKEVMEAIKEHGDWVCLKSDNWTRKIVAYETPCKGKVNFRIVSISNSVRIYEQEEALNILVFADGTPFGVKED